MGWWTTFVHSQFIKLETKKMLIKAETLQLFINLCLLLAPSSYFVTADFPSIHCKFHVFVVANAVDDIDIWNQPRLCQDLLWGRILFEYFALTLIFMSRNLLLPHPILLKVSFYFVHFKFVYLNFNDHTKIMLKTLACSTTNF